MKRMFAVGAVLAFLSSAPAFSDNLTAIRILALSPAEARGVIIDEEGLARILVPGDALLNGEYQVRQILSDRLVLEDKAKSQPNATTWLFKPGSEQSDPRVQRFEQEPEEEFMAEVTNTSIELGLAVPQ